MSLRQSMYTGLAQPEVKTNGRSSKNSTAFTSSSILAVVSAMNAWSAKCMSGANFNRLESAYLALHGESCDGTGANNNREDDAARREAVRRNSALLATYTSAQDIDEARSRALADNQKAVKEVELRIEAIKKRQASYDKELELYKGDNKPPARLQDDIRDAEIDLQAQENLLAVKKKDADTINAKYDQDKQRYLELTGRR